MGGHNIQLPPFLSVTIESEDLPGGDWWHSPRKQFVVLNFGYSEVGRWEWEADKPVSNRRELDEDEVGDRYVTDFVAEKLREKLFPEES